MKRRDTYLIYSDIIYNYLKGDISKDEEELLKCWLKNERNAVFFNQLINTDLLYNKMQEMSSIDTDNAFRQLLCKRNKRRYLKYFYISACVVTLILSGTFLWKINTPEKEQALFLAESFPVENRIEWHTSSGKVFYISDSVKGLSSSALNDQNEEKKKTPKNEASDNEPNPLNILITPNNGFLEFILSDSTKVWLNEKSLLRYPDKFTDNKRSVYIEGEVYFDVKPDKNAPFIVYTNTTEIEVLGTSFNVKEENKHCTVTLTEGCIKMTGPGNKHVVLHENQQVSVSENDEMYVRFVDPTYTTAWKRNCFAFKEESLEHIMQVLSEWYHCSFSFDISSLAGLTYTTIIQRYPKLSQVLDILSRTGDFTFSEDGDSIIINRSKKQFNQNDI